MSKTCTVEGCEGKFLAKEMCSLHYERARRGKDVDAPVRDYGTREERFWPKVKKSDGCWEWGASKNSAGYAVLGGVVGSHLAHRISYEMHNGPIPPGLSIDHMCRNRGCVNPEHLRLATHAINNQNKDGARSSSRSGVRGVRRYRDTDRWVARATLAGKYYHIGYFGSLEDADAAATEWRRTNMPYSTMDQRKAS